MAKTSSVPPPATTPPWPEDDDREFLGPAERRCSVCGTTEGELIGFGPYDREVITDYECRSCWGPDEQNEALAPPGSPCRTLEEHLAMLDEIERNAPEDDEELPPDVAAELLASLEEARAGHPRPSISSEELCARLGLRR